MSYKVDKIIRSKRKTLSLQVLDDGSLLIKAPKRINDKEIYAFIERHKDWVEQRIGLVEKQKRLLNKIEPNGRTLLLGKNFTLQHSSYVNKPVLVGQKVMLNFQDKQIALEMLENWYRKIAKDNFEKRIYVFAQLMGLKFSKVKLSSATKRWGSCSSLGNINLNWRLIMAPQEIIDYVIVHELSHLKEMNHSQKFWNEVGKVLPDYKERRNWLKNYGYRLKI